MATPRKFSPALPVTPEADGRSYLSVHSLAGFDFGESHRPDHVGGDVETGYPTAGVAIKVHQELALTQVANIAMGKSRFQFLIFSHPVLPDELAIVRDKCPCGAQFVIRICPG
jgi:hypothetical protein